MRNPPGPRSKHEDTTLNRWVGISVILLAAALAYALFLRHGVAPAVVGYNLVPSERVLSGEVPYRDFIYNYTPGVLWLNAGLFKLLGTTLMTARIGVYAAKVASVLLLYLVGKRYLPGWLRLLPVFMALSWVGYGDILKVFPTQYGMAFLLAAWALLNHAQAAGGSGENAKPGARRLAILAGAGAFAGAVLVFKHNVGLFVCAGMVLASAASCWRQHDVGSRPNRKGALICGLAALVGTTAVAVPAAVYLASRSALLPMLDHFRRHAVAYEEAKGIALPPPSALLASSLGALAVAGAWLIMHRKSRRLAASFSTAIVVLLLVIVVVGDRGAGAAFYRSLAAQVYYLPIYSAVAGATWIIAEYRNGNRARAAALIPLVVMPAAAFVEVFPRSDPDHLVRVLPPSLLLICVLVHEVARRMSAGGSIGIRRPLASSVGLAVNSRSTGESCFSTEASPVSQSESLDGSKSSGWLLALPVVAVAIVISAIGVRVTWMPQFDSRFHMVENTPLQFERARGIRGSEFEADRFNRIVEFVEQHSNPGDPIFTTARKMTAVYFFAARPNTTRMLWFDSPGIPVDDRNLVYQRIADRRYRLILIGGGEPDREAAGKADSYEAPVLALLKEHYHRIATIDGISIFEPGSGP